jgi:cytoskeletal protein RodZ
MPAMGLPANSRNRDEDWFSKAPIALKAEFSDPKRQSRYNVFMWGRIIIGAVVVVLVAVWLLAIWFLIADPRVIVDSRVFLPKFPAW